MQYRPLGQSGLAVSAIGMGCVTLGREIDETASRAVLDRALERGITFFDTAEGYGDGESEEILGRWLADRNARDRVVLATKMSPPQSRQRVREAAEESLRRLNTDVIDLFYLHAWDSDTPVEETAAGLDDLVRQGKIKAAGCSNLKAWQLCKMLLAQQGEGSCRVQAVQPAYNLVDRAVEDELLPLCADQQIASVTYSPLAAGFLTGKYRRDGEIPQGSRFDVRPGHQPLYMHDAGFAVLDRLEAVAERTGQSVVQLSLAWVMAQPTVTSVLIGARTPAQVDQAFDARDLTLSDETIAQLGGA